MLNTCPYLGQYHREQEERNITAGKTHCRRNTYCRMEDILQEGRHECRKTTTIINYYKTAVYMFFHFEW